MKFDLTRPCNNCPFRTDLTPYLRSRLVQEILGCGKVAWPATWFACHKTVDYSDGGNKGRVHENTQHCAGVLIILQRDGRPNDAMQLAERFGYWDPKALDMSSPVYASAKSALAAHERADDHQR